MPLILLVPYPPPSDVRVEAIERSRIVFAWNKTIGAQCSSVQYIITSVNCGACPNTTIDTNITCVELSVRNHTCMFAVQTEICGYLVGSRSEYLIVNLFGKYTVAIVLGILLHVLVRLAFKFCVALLWFHEASIGYINNSYI